VHRLVDRTGLELGGAGEWPLEKHGTKTRRSWRKLHIEMDAETSEILAAVLTTNAVDEASQVGPLLGQVAEPVA
jgi:Transposase DDE domain